LLKTRDVIYKKRSQKMSTQQNAGFDLPTARATFVDLPTKNVEAQLSRPQNKNTSIVIPTYNERDNIHELLERVYRSVEPLGCAFEIIIVDDDSPDETWDVASRYADLYRTRVIRRQGESGLATAVLSGIEAANYDIIVVMDADLQHPPEKIPELISCVANGSDIAIGSRFVDHGEVGEFGVLRRLISAGAAFLARTAFRKLRNVKDLESGFFAFNKNIVNGVSLRPVGYKILLELLVQAKYASVAELGYAFQNREAGSSKLNGRNVIDYAHHVSSLFYRSGELRRFAQFGVVGGVGAVLNLATLYWLTQAGMFYLAAGLVAMEVNILSNFGFNRSWTFKDRSAGGVKHTLSALGKDHAVRLVGVPLNLAILFILTSFFGVFYLFSELISLGVRAVRNYVGNQWWTWP
jgi:dolichol-phosphate mannosyltransferase